MALWESSVARSRAAIARVYADGGADVLIKVPWPDGRTPSLRRIMVDMIEEYGRHTGHADLIRESIDGLVGEETAGMSDATGYDEAVLTEPPRDGTEIETLVGSLERVYLAWKCGGLDAAAMRTTLGPSSLTLGGLLKHLASSARVRSPAVTARSCARGPTSRSPRSAMSIVGARERSHATSVRAST